MVARILPQNRARKIGFPNPPYDPIPRYSETSKKDLPLLEVTKEELSALPDPLQKLRSTITKWIMIRLCWDLEPSREQRHRQRAYYLANVTMIDEKIERFFIHWRNLGYLENGIVVFCSDHGDCLTDHDSQNGQCTI